VPGFQVKPVDTTAAGDTFNGALAVALAEGQPLIDAVRFANAAAAISVTRIGAQPSIPTRIEIDRLLKRKTITINAASRSFRGPNRNGKSRRIAGAAQRRS
jgi:ribokinase